MIANANRIGGIGRETTSIDLSQWQRAYVRRLLFQDLRELAEYLAQQANDAADSHDDVKVVGEDARSTAHTTLAATVCLLDAFGWDTSGDARALCDHERATRTGAGGREA